MANIPALRADYAGSIPVKCFKIRTANLKKSKRTNNGTKSKFKDDYCILFKACKLQLFDYNAKKLFI